jgi:hypothetical protein
MKIQLTKPRFQGGPAFALIAAAVCMLSTALVIGADTNSTNTVATATKEAKETKETKEKKPAPKKLTGAELYAINCNRCHPERYPTEFNSAQWKTIMMHMRVRANLPAKQAKEVLKYLQEEGGN